MFIFSTIFILQKKKKFIRISMTKRKSQGNTIIISTIK